MRFTFRRSALGVAREIDDYNRRGGCVIPIALFAMLMTGFLTMSAWACPPGNNELRDICNTYWSLSRSNNQKRAQFYTNKFIIDGCDRVIDPKTGRLK